MAEKLKIAIIGTGGIAHAHMRAYAQMDDIEIVGGADIVPGKARAFFDEFNLPNAAAYTDHQLMLKECKPDAVSVCTYNSTHAECSINAMRSGSHVLCEKPMSIFIAEALSMLEVSEATGKILSIGFQPRYDPNMLMIRDIVRSGQLGKVYYIQTGGGRRRGIPGRTFIDKKLAGVGALADIGCYALDMALNAIDYPKPLTVSATATNYFGTNPKYYADADKFTVDDFSAAFIRLEGDITLDFRMSWAMHMNTTGNTLFLGTDAGLKVEPAGQDVPWGGAWDGTIGPVYLYHDVAGNMAETSIPLKREQVDRFYLKVRDFVEAVQKGGKAPIPASQIIYNQAIIDGIIRSSECGHEVEVKI